MVTPGPPDDRIGLGICHGLGVCTCGECHETDDLALPTPVCDHVADAPAHQHRSEPSELQNPSRLSGEEIKKRLTAALAEAADTAGWALGLSDEEYALLAQAVIDASDRWDDQ